MEKHLHCIDSSTRMLQVCMHFCLVQHISNDRDFRIFGIESYDHVLTQYHIFCICFHRNFYNTNRMICPQCKFQIDLELDLSIRDDATFCKSHIVCNLHFQIFQLCMGDKNGAYVSCSKGGVGVGISTEKIEKLKGWRR